MHASSLLILLAVACALMTLRQACSISSQHLSRRITILQNGIQISSPAMLLPCCRIAIRLLKSDTGLAERRSDTSQHASGLALASLATALSIPRPAGAIGGDKTASSWTVLLKCMAQRLVNRCFAVKTRPLRPDKVMVRQGLATRLPPPTFWRRAICVRYRQIMI